MSAYTSAAFQFFKAREFHKSLQNNNNNNVYDKKKKLPVP